IGYFVTNGAGEKEDIADYAVSLAGRLGIEYCEAYFEHSTSTFYAIEQGKFNASAYIETNGLRIRLIKNKKLYTFSTNRLEKEHIKEKISRFKGFSGIDTDFSEEKIESAD